ncbi:MAG TPA: D-glycero-beta-D-manno-heptose-7-phosphate kinase [Armatimonadetes bacterium]|nr:D-glycero-beta-D-manno-heptose-7-phosphate kinase [Armatimonadota bacterium]
MGPDMLQQLHEVVDRLSGKRIVVLGDYMLDRYIWGGVTRISPEAPVPVVEVAREDVVPGGAGNVVRNLADLGILPMVCGIIGQDEAGATLEGLLAEMNADLSPLVRAQNRRTTAKIRIIGNHQQVVRVDYDYSAEPEGDLYQTLIEQTSHALESADAVIFSDYSKGVLTEGVSRAVLARASEKGLKVCVDPKPAHIPRFSGAWLISPNEAEAERATGIDIDNDSSAVAAARTLLECANLQAAVITRGGKGMCIYQADGNAHLIPAVPTEVFDVTGAGDTAISVLAACLACDAPLLHAAIIANTAGGEVVRHIGCATVTPEQLHGALDDKAAELERITTVEVE